MMFQCFQFASVLSHQQFDHQVFFSGQQKKYYKLQSYTSINNQNPSITKNLNYPTTSMNHSIVPHLQACHYSSPDASYTRLMKSSTRIHPLRQPYVPMRMINEVYGKTINRELHDGYAKVSESIAQKNETMARRWDNARKQSVDLICDRLHL